MMFKEEMVSYMTYEMKMREAHDDGREENGIKAMILALKELNVDKAIAIDKVSTHFHLQANVAKGYVETNW